MLCSHSCFLGIISLQFAFISILLYDKYFKAAIKSESTTPTDFHQELLPLDFSTSVFCTGNNKKERECRFKNLCFDPIREEYLYFHGNQSKQYGLPKVTPKPPLLDLSSVDDHNAKYFTYTDVMTHSYGKRKMKFIRGSTILFHRFNPENLMHVLHDDLLPHFHTKRKYFPDTNITTVMMDDRDKGPYFELYELFTRPILHKNMLQELTCFEDVVVGLSKKITWYQYGFKQPQGPINIDGYPLEELYYFRKDFFNRLGVQSKNQAEGSSIVFISRKVSRKIMNEMELVFKLSTYFKMEVITFDLQFDNIRDIIESVSKANFLVGVHGAHLIASLFLPPTGALVEIFPFAVPSKNYVPYKTLAHLRGIRYIAWENKNEEDSISHPYRPPNMGGIANLPLSLQTKIKETKTVPDHLCCHDPFWLYRIYQDTRVDINSLFEQIENELTTDRKITYSGLFPYFYPALVNNIKCSYDNNLQGYQINWDPPWNLLWVSPKSITYDVLLQGSAGKDSINEIRKVSGRNFLQVSLLEGNNLDIFIRCIFDNKTSEFSEKQQCF